MNINAIIHNTPDSILKGIARRVKEKRLEYNFTQKAFAKRAGVGYDAYRKFENTGEIVPNSILTRGEDYYENDLMEELGGV